MLDIFKSLRKVINLLFIKENEIYYINGPEVLPAPLTHEEEIEILSKADDDPTVRSLLVEHNLRLVVYIAKKFENTGVGIEDLISIGTIGLIKSINTFKADKNIKLATYASRCIENEILMYIRKSGNQRSEMSIDEPLSTDWDGNELLLSDIIAGDDDSVFRNMELTEDKRTIYEAIDRLGSREKTIVQLRFGLCGGKELTQKEVADALGISQSYISRLEKRIMKKLKSDISGRL